MSNTPSNIVTVKTLKGTVITIDLENNTATADPIGTISYVSIHDRQMMSGRIMGMIKTTTQKIPFLDPNDLAEKVSAWNDSQLEAQIPGLNALTAAYEAGEKYNAACALRMEGATVPKAPQVNIQELQAEYPRAATYLQAEEFMNASNYKKSGAGRDAKQIILDGGSIEAAQATLKNWN